MVDTDKYALAAACAAAPRRFNCLHCMLRLPFRPSPPLPAFSYSDALANFFTVDTLRTIKSPPPPPVLCPSMGIGS